MQTNSILNRGVEEIIEEEKFKKIFNSGKKLRVKFGIDPTATDLHLGHAVCLHKLREFQEQGHKIVLIIGDFTAQIGDPTGRTKAREFLTRDQIKKNLKTYLKQAGIILDIKKCEIHYNSSWFEKGKTALFMQLAQEATVARLIEREDFKERMKNKQDIKLIELFYPLMQGYDSVMVKADVEVGGTEQKFNLLMGRELQRKYSQKPQTVITMPLLVGLDGTKKMSKSYNNYIGLTEPATIQYGKVMSIPDSLMINYFELAARTSGKELEKIKKQFENPEKRRKLKASLARDIVTLMHGAEAAVVAEEDFNRVFKDKKNPTDIPVYKLKKEMNDKLVNILVNLKLVTSKSEARRLIIQKAVKIDGAPIEDPEAKISLHDDMIIKVGKLKFLKIVK